MQLLSIVSEMQFDKHILSIYMCRQNNAKTLEFHDYDNDPLPKSSVWKRQIKIIIEQHNNKSTYMEQKQQGEVSNSFCQKKKEEQKQVAEGKEYICGQRQGFRVLLSHSLLI